MMLSHQGTAELSYFHGGTMASLGLRAYSYQFDDDLNQFLLPGYTTVQFVARQRIVKSLSADVSLENGFDRIYYTAFTPTPNTGSPRLWRSRTPLRSAAFSARRSASG